MQVDPSQPILQVQVSGKVQFPLRHELVHIATSSEQHEILKQNTYNRFTFRASITHPSF